MKRLTLGVVSLLLATSVLGQSTQSLKIDSSSQTDIALTIYNNFALVRDTRNAVLPRGELLLEFGDVAQTLEPSSVSIRNNGGSKLDVLEQSYRYDLLNRDSLLSTYIGKKIKYSSFVLRGDDFEKMLREGVLLSINPEIVDFGDVVEISPEGVVSLSDVPDSFSLSPTLDWRLFNEHAGERSITTSYIANQISWRADYVLALNEDSETLDLTSWATLKNDSGASFENASIRLIAGSVNRTPKAANFRLGRA